MRSFAEREGENQKGLQVVNGGKLEALTASIDLSKSSKYWE